VVTVEKIEKTDAERERLLTPVGPSVFATAEISHRVAECPIYPRDLKITE
jgi:prefoldin subunit 5